MSGENANDAGEETSNVSSPRRRAKPVGCAAMLFLCGLALLSGGIYQVNQWDQLQGPGRSAAVMLVVLGALLLLPLVAALIAAVLFLIFLRRFVKSAKAAAGQLAQVGRILVGGNNAMTHRLPAPTEDDSENTGREEIGSIDPEAVHPVDSPHDGAEDTDGFADLSPEAAEKARQADRGQ